MKNLSHYIASKLIKNHEMINDPEVRSRYGVLEGWVSIIGNIVLFLIKLFIGIRINSTALLADAAHTLADSATSLIVIIGFIMMKKPSDKKHPFGHGKIEPVLTLIVSILLFVTGFEFLRISVNRLIHPVKTHADLYVILIITGTIVLKEIMARFSFSLGDLIDSDALKADALHHRSDVFATTLVIVALISSQYNYLYVDGAMGVLISFTIFYSAFFIAKTAINPLLGEAPPEKLLKEIKSTAMSIRYVTGVHDIIFHQYGQTIVVSLHIEVSGKMSAEVSHDISEAVERKISAKTGGVVVVHVDPINNDHPQYDEIIQLLKKIITNDERVDSFHDLRVIGSSEERCSVIFEISLSPDLEDPITDHIIDHITSEFKIKFPNMKIVIKTDPKYSYSPR